jgi:hypothetical protein
MNRNIEINGNMDLGAYSPLELTEGDVNESLKEKAVSKAQQRFFGMVDAYKKGEMPDASQAIKKAADGMTKKQVKDFAKTKHKGLPNHVDENTLVRLIRESIQEHLVDVLGRYTQGKATPKEANKAIMDLANSSNIKLKTRLNESFKSGIIKNFADKYGIGYADPALSEITDDMILRSKIVTEWPGQIRDEDQGKYLVYKGKDNVWLVLTMNRNFRNKFDYTYFDWGMQKPYLVDKYDELRRRRRKWDGEQGVKRNDGKYNYVYHSKRNRNPYFGEYTNQDFTEDMYWKNHKKK